MGWKTSESGAANSYVSRGSKSLYSASQKVQREGCVRETKSITPSLCLCLPLFPY